MEIKWFPIIVIVFFVSAFGLLSIAEYQKHHTIQVCIKNSHELYKCKELIK